MAPEPDDLLLHRYRIKRPLGQGGAASGFLAHDLVWDRPIALKLLHARSPSLIASLRFEFDTLRSLHHPRLSRVHDLCLLDSATAGPLHPFFTADFIDGLALDVFANGRAWSEVAVAVTDALDALCLLHQAGVRHGDIKPGNVLVQGGRGTLIDLGCAGAMHARPDGTVSGTAGLLAPELIEGGSADGRADLYAFGRTLELISPTVSGVPPSVVALVKRLVQANPEDRPTSTEEVLEALGRQAAIHHPVVRCLGRLGGREKLLRRVAGLLDDLAAGRAGPRVVHFAGLPGVGTSRMLRELKFLAQQRAAVIEANPRRPGALGALVSAAIGHPTPCTSVAQVMNAWDSLAARVGSPFLPFVMILDDLPSVSDADLNLVRALARAVPPEHPVMLATAGTPGQLPQGRGSLELVVEPLSHEELACWIDGTLSLRATAQLHGASGGLPGRIEDVLRRLAAGSLTEVGLAEAVASSTDDSHSRRLQGVDLPIRRAAVTLSISGQNLVSEDLRALGVDAEKVNELVRIGWLIPNGAGWRVLPLGSAPQGAQLERMHEVVARWLEAKALREGQGAHRARLLARQSEHLACAGRLQDARQLLRDEEGNHALAVADWKRAAERIADRCGDLSAQLDAVRLSRLSGDAAGALARLEAWPIGEQERSSFALLHEQGAVLLSLGERHRARACLEQAMESSPDAPSRARVAGELARCLNDLGAHREALACADDALEDCVDGAAWATLQEAAGLALSYLGEPKLARQRFQVASERLAPLSRPRDEVRMSGNLALVAYRAGELAEAARGYERALALAEEHGFADQVANAALNHGTLAHQLGLLGSALRSYERGLRMASALGRQSTEAMLCFNLAKLYADIGSFDRATEYADRSERLAEDVGAPGLVAAIQAVRAEVALGTGDAAGASRHLTQAQAWLRTPGQGGRARPAPAAGGCYPAAPRRHKQRSRTPRPRA